MPYRFHSWISVSTPKDALIQAFPPPSHKHAKIAVDGMHTRNALQQVLGDFLVRQIRGQRRVGFRPLLKSGLPLDIFSCQLLGVLSKVGLCLRRYIEGLGWQPQSFAGSIGKLCTTLAVSLLSASDFRDTLQNKNKNISRATQAHSNLCPMTTAASHSSSGLTLTDPGDTWPQRKRCDFTLHPIPSGANRGALADTFPNQSLRHDKLRFAGDFPRLFVCCCKRFEVMTVHAATGSACTSAVRNDLGDHPRMNIAPTHKFATQKRDNLMTSKPTASIRLTQSSLWVASAIASRVTSFAS